MKCIKHYNAPMNEHSFEFNTKIKVFPNGEKKVKYHTYSNTKGLYRKRGESSAATSEKKRYENLYNSKQKLIDLVYCNSLISPWEYFITLTFDPKKVDSFNYQEVVGEMHKWLDNQKHQNKNIEYVLVPELHKSGAIHIHGLIKNVPKWELIPARYPKSNRLIYKHGCQIFNLSNYKYGFTEISKIKSQEAVSVYMSKYMTKELINLSGRHTYWRARSLKSPKIEYAHLDPESLKFFIDKNIIKDYYENDKTVSFTSFG